MGVNLKGGNYLTIEEFRQLIKYKTKQPIYRAIREGRLVGAKNIGTKESPRWLIPASASIENNTIKHGAYIGISKKVRDARKMYLTRSDT